jgi:hypothetical protein
MNGMCRLMRLEMPDKKAAICSWMCIRKVSEDQRPCLRMVSRSSPLSFIAMAPPARREWLLTRSGVKPQRCNLRARVAAFTAVLMWEERMCRVRPLAKHAERGGVKVNDVGEDVVHPTGEGFHGAVHGAGGVVMGMASMGAESSVVLSLTEGKSTSTSRKPYDRSS